MQLPSIVNSSLTFIFLFFYFFYYISTDLFLWNFFLLDNMCDILVYFNDGTDDCIRGIIAIDFVSIYTIL